MIASVPPLSRAAVLVGLAGILAGCNTTLTRRETISPHAGDAIAWNRAVHTIDPWPAASYDTTIPTSGRRVAQAIENYETALAKEQQTTATTSVTFLPLAPMAPGAAPLK